MKKITIGIIALVVILVIGVAVGLNVSQADAHEDSSRHMGPECSDLNPRVPNMAMTKADTHKASFAGGRFILVYVRAEWHGVSAAAKYRMEATRVNYGHTWSDTDTPSYSGGKSMDTVRVGNHDNAFKAHDVRVLALNRAGNVIACGQMQGHKYGAGH